MSLAGPFRVRLVPGPISTDDILPASVKHKTTDPARMALHVFENRLPGFAATLGKGDILVSNELFGIGSSREQAVSSLLGAGVAGVIAPEFGRIFFRNAWNLGLYALPIAGCDLAEGERFHLELGDGVLVTATRTLSFPRTSPHLLEIVREGGLLARLRRSLGTRPESP